MKDPRSTGDVRREEARNGIRSLVIIDIDQVLAMYRGGDCQAGSPIYRTFKRAPKPPQNTTGNPVDVAIVTHRVRAEANCILEAVGLTAWSRNIITANDLLGESVRMMVLGRRMGGLSKGIAGGILTRRMGIYDHKRSVMIDNHLPNLFSMIRANVVGFGLLTPMIICDDVGCVRSFDLQAVLDTAVTLAGGTSSETASSSPPVLAGGELRDGQGDSGWQGIADPYVSPKRRADASSIFRIPLMGETWRESDLHTGRKLIESPLDLVTVLRTLKRQIAKVLT